VNPEDGVTGVLLLEEDKPTTRVPATPEEIESVRAGMERRRSAPLHWREAQTDTDCCTPA